jgi:aryl-alcohol dehydrogenase-like predicted oxidoreductase
MTLGAGGALALRPELLQAIQQGQLIKRAIPSTGEMLPVVGLGTSATFSTVARSEDFSALREVMRAMLDNGATVFDTAPIYGASEQVGGTIASELGITDRVFWATKVNVAGGRGRGSSSADPARARAQIDTSFSRIKKDKIDLIQVHNLGDMPTQLGILKELKAAGRIRYIGATSTSDNAYPRLMEYMRNEPLDFVGIGYAVDDRALEADLLPLALERKIGVLVYQPFGRRRLWNRVEGRELPPWAADIDAKTWAQFFIKYVAAHPAVTCVTPATSQARHMIDNIGGGVGRLPDEAMRKRMADFVDALPAPPSGRGRGGI